MGETFRSLDQLYKYFSGNYVFPSPKLNENQTNKQKRSLEKFEVIFSAKSGENQKKSYQRNLRPYSAGNLYRIF